MIIISCDPGLEGSVSVVGLPSGKILDLFALPTITYKTTGKKVINRRKLDLLALAKKFDEIAKLDTDYEIILEDIFIIPSPFACLNFGKEWGKLFGLLCVYFGKEPKLVRAVTWKKYIFEGKTTKGNKQLSIDKVKEFYPDIDLTMIKKNCLGSTDVKRKKLSDGMAEAVLIGKYGIDNLIEVTEDE